MFLIRIPIIFTLFCFPLHSKGFHIKIKTKTHDLRDNYKYRIKIGGENFNTQKIFLSFSLLSLRKHQTKHKIKAFICDVYMKNGTVL